jgi:hypothetical protein
VNCFKWQTLPTVKRKYFFMNILLIKFFANKIRTTERCPSVVHTPQTRSPFWLLKTASEHGNARLLLRLSWSWTVLLPSVTHRKSLTSITALLRPFMTYLLTVEPLWWSERSKRYVIAPAHFLSSTYSTPSVWHGFSLHVIFPLLSPRVGSEGRFHCRCCRSLVLSRARETVARVLPAS